MWRYRGLSLIQLLALIWLAVWLVAWCYPLYAFEIHYASLTEMTGKSASQLMYSYQEMIHYLLGRSNQKWLTFRYFPSSVEGAIHFFDVKRLFQIGSYLGWSCVVVSLWWLIRKAKTMTPDEAYQLYHAFRQWLILIAFIMIMISVNFQYFFLKFHEFVFSNDYWMMDPNTDPIILALPESYFFHALLAFVCLLIMGIISYLWFFKRKAATTQG